MMRMKPMELRLAYGENGITLEIPEGVEIDRYGLTAVDTPYTFEQFSALIRSTGGAKTLGSERLLVAVNDGYRRTPTARILAWLDKYDPALLDRCDFLIAAGTHAAPTPEHLDTIFGGVYSKVQDRVSWHDARDLATMRKVGVDATGNDVYINKQYLDAASVLIIGSVEPHYFAGYTGGRKSIVPGLADIATTERNHNLANSLDAQPLRLEGNPVAEGLAAILDLVDTTKVYSIQLVQDAGGRIHSIFCGDIRGSFEQSLDAAHHVFAHDTEKPYDVVLAELRPPLDRNLYQGQKAVENTQMAVRDGGSVVVVSECREGIGAPHYFKLAEQWDRESNQAKDGVQRFGSHKLSRVNGISRRIHVRLFSEVPVDDARQVFYEPIDDLQTWLNETLGEGGRLAVVFDAGNSVLQMARKTEKIET